PLSLEQLRRDPYQASDRAVRVDEGLDLWPRWNLAYQHVWQPAPAHRIAFGAQAGRTAFVNPNANLELSYRSRDYGLSLRHEWDGQFARRPMRWLWGVNLAWSQTANQTHGPVWLADVLLDSRPLLFEDIQSRVWTHELYTEGRWQVLPNVAVVGGLLATWARREVDLDVVNQTQLSPLFREVERAERYAGLSPRLGVVWQVASLVQGFANLSRSFEPPTGAEFVSVSGALQAQRATTLEVGSRGGEERFNWEVAAYHSRVSPELLGIEFPPNSGRFVAENIDRTHRFGLEAKLRGAWRLPGRMGRMHWDLAYTWSRGRILESEGFDGKVLPGIPIHYGRLALRYLHPDGWYGGPDWELASGWYVDQANTLRAPGYGLLHLTGGYASRDGRGRVFVSVRNLMDKTYVASTPYLVAARPGVEAFQPGQGRTWIAGVQWKW
ncbi:MAG: TonB-dependent receptor, partial [Pigmentiphaga sp.]